MQKASRKILGSLIFSIICTTLFLPGIPAADVHAQEEDEYLFVRSWGDEAQRLEHPTIVGVGPDNKIYVVNDGRMTVITQENQTYSVWLDYQSSTTYNVTTSSIAFDSDGNILLTDFRNPDSADFQAVSKYSPKGELILSFGEYGSGEGQLRMPNGIAVDSQDNIYVSDEYRGVIVKFC